MNEHLGKTLGAVNAEINGISDFLDDPITKQSGCADELLPLISRSVLRRVEQILRDAGYTNFSQFLYEIEARTNPKWAYFNSGIEHLEDLSSEPFWKREI